MKYSRFQQWIDTLLHKGRVSKDEYAQMNSEEQKLLRGAKLFIASRHNNEPYRMEFKEELRQKLLQLAAGRKKQKQQQKKTIWQALHVKGLAGAGVLALSLAVVAFTLYQPGVGVPIIHPGDIGGILIPAAQAHDNFSLEAETVDEYGVIAPQTDFLLSSKTKISESDLKTFLSLEGVESFEIETVRRGYEYRIDPSSDLSSGAVLHVSVASVTEENGALLPYTYEWAFEVSDHFKILYSSPSDETNYVALNSAIHLELSHSRTIDPSAYIEIQPEHPFTIQQGFRSIDIVPTEPWELNQLYVVKLKKDFGIDPAFIPETGEGPWQLERDFVIRFTTGTASTNISSGFSFETEVLQTRPGEEAVLSGWGYRLPVTTPMDVEVFRVDESTVFAIAERLASMNGWVPDVIQNNLVDRVITDFRLEVVRNRQTVNLKQDPLYGSMMFAVDGLDQTGIYLVKSTIDGASALHFWSVSDVGGFFTVSSQKGFVWTVDVSRNRPLGNVSVRSSAGNLGVTNAEGVLTLSASQVASLQPDDLFILSFNGQLTLHPIHVWSSPIVAEPVYQSFLLADQYLVHPDDTVRFWGMVRRDDQEVQQVRVELNSYSSGLGTLKVHEQIVSVNASGFFSGQMQLSNLRDGYLGLSVWDGDHLIQEKSLDVRTFAVPEISLVAQSQYQRIDAGENNRVDITARRFDGQPAAFMELHVSGNYTGRVTTDENGLAHITVPSKVSDCSEYGCNNDYYWIEVRPVGAASGESFGQTNWIVTQSFTEINSRWERQDDSIVLDADIKGLEYQSSDKSYPPESEIAKFAAAGVPFRVQVFEITSQRSSLQSEFDSLSNETRYFYDFSRLERLVDTHQGLTNDKGELSVRIPIASNTNYRARVQVLDPLGRYDGRETYMNLVTLPGGRQYVEGQTDDDFTSNETVSYDDYLDLRIHIEHQETYRLGDTVEITASLGEESVLPEDASVFFYTASPELLDGIVATSPTTTLTLREDYLPNVVIGAASVWNGHLYMHDYFKPDISLSVPERELQINLETEEESYGIGDEAVIHIHVTDENNQPVQAELQVNVLDQAYLDLEAYEEGHNPFADLYRHEYARIYVETRTHRDVFPFADGGGGGGDGLRADFAEQAHYEITQTDRSGNATIRFTLPDNITTWSVGVAAATSDGYAGVEQGEIVVTQPLVIEPIQSDSYLLADEIVLSARARAADIDKAAEVQYSFYGPIKDREGVDSLEDFPVASQTAASSLGTAVDFPVKISEAGNYAYAIRATVGGEQDAIIQHFTVVSGRLTQSVTETFALGNTWQAQQPSQETTRVDVRFGSEVGADAFEALQSICACGSRLDILLSWQESRRLLGSYFAVETPGRTLRLENEYKSPNGGLARFPFGEEDLRMSSAVAVFLKEDPEARAELIAYFNENLKDDRSTEEHVLALHGLAALSADGAYAKARYFVSQADLTLTDKIVMADAFLLFGDKTKARELWSEVADEAVTYRDGQISFAEDLFVNEPYDTVAASKEWAAYGALIAHELGDRHWKDLWIFAIHDASPDIEVRLWAARLKAQPVSEMSFVARFGENEQFVTLRGFENFGLSLTPAELSQLSVIDIRGNLQAMYAYETVSVPESTLGGVSVSRTFLQGGAATNTLDPDREVEVRLVIRAQNAQSYGQYLLEDYLPSGLAALTRGYTWTNAIDGCELIPYRTDAHKAKAVIDLSERCPVVTVQYRARLTANSGSYVSEGTKVSSSQSDALFVGESTTLKISP